MENPRYQDWIEDYLLGKLSREEREAFETRRMADPQFAHEVEESRRAFQAIQAARQNQLKTKLALWDQKSNRLKRAGRILFILLAVFIVGTVLISFGYYQLCQPDQIVKRFSNRTPGVSQTDFTDMHLQRNWEAGIQALEAHRYQLAQEYFYPIASDPTSPLAARAQWYILLTQFGSAGESPEWREDLAAFIASAAPPYRDLAIELQQILTSPFYRLFFLKFLHQFIPSIQPSIM
jgi:hypothetical protein